MIKIRKILAEDCWPIRHEVMWPDRDITYVKLPKDAEGIHYGLYKNDRLIVVISYFVEDGEAQFRKFACVKDEQGKGYGGQLLSFMLAEMSRSSIKRIFCNARVEKTTFYEKFGLRKIENYFEKGGKAYVVMEKFNNSLWKELIEIIYADNWMMDRLREVQSCKLPDAWIGAGFIRNRVWDVKHEIFPPNKLNDIDVIFFDEQRVDKGYEQEIEAYLLSLCPSENWSVKNQARMHEKHGHSPYQSSEEAISHWVETPTCVACRLEPNFDKLEIIAPHGIEDLMNMKVRPNPNLTKGQFELYNDRIKQKGWKDKWPLLDILYLEI